MLQIENFGPSIFFKVFRMSGHQPMLSCTSTRVTIAFLRTASSFFQVGFDCCLSRTIRAFCAHILTHFRRLEFLNCRDWIGALLWFRLTPSTGGLCLFAYFAKKSFRIMSGHCGVLLGGCRGCHSSPVSPPASVPIKTQVEGLENDTEEVVLHYKVTLEQLTAFELCLSQI